jgi:D-serine deaminase-like pyridoxal phosphate-dependent protein
MTGHWSTEPAAGRDVASIATPALVVDLNRMERNLAKMQRAVNGANCALRPHAKTHKSTELATLQVELGAQGIAVAKTSEAEKLCGAGVDDVLVGNEIVGSRQVARLAELAHSKQVTTCVDSPVGVKRLSAAATAAKSTLSVLIDLDVGLGRTGIRPNAALALARAVNRAPGLALSGVFAYAGNAPATAAEEEVRAFAQAEARAAVALADALVADGLPCEVVSVSGTPGAVHAARVPGVTEVRPGGYIFYDTNLLTRGACGLDDCALMVLSTVVSKPSHSTVVVDAGSKTLTTEGRPRGVTASPPVGKEVILDHPGARIVGMWEEHSVVALGGDDFKVAIGDRIFIVPFHACPVVNLADQMIGVRGELIERAIRVDARGLVF